VQIKIEHGLFNHISMNWRGRPLTSHEVIVDLISATTTRSGLTVRADRDEGNYPTGTKVTDDELAAVPREAHRFHDLGPWTPGGPGGLRAPRTRSMAVADRPSLSGAAFRVRGRA